ncbi:MAG: GAF domain-containing sensor histidine kinase [Proteobacteria bacterium]|nr:GAF domain-containing sensor histidine kinase [Pseudomonadota bacterium]
MSSSPPRMQSTTVRVTWFVGALLLLAFIIYLDISDRLRVSHSLMSVTLVVVSLLFTGMWSTPVVAAVATLLCLHDIYTMHGASDGQFSGIDQYLGLALVWIAAALVQYKKRNDWERDAVNTRARQRQSSVVELATDPSVIAGDITATAKLASELLAKHLTVARASVWFLGPDRLELCCINLFESNSGKHSSGVVLRAKDYPRYFAALDSGRAIDANDARTDPRTSEYRDGYLVPLGITSMLDAGIRVAGRNFGVVCCEHIGTARNWGADELGFASEIADQIAQAIVNEENRRANEAVRSNERKYRDLVETSNDLIWALDSNGCWSFLNRGAAERILGFTPEELIGRPVSELQTRQQARQDKGVLERVRSGEALFFYETIFIKKDGVPVNLSFNAIALRNDAGEVIGITGTATDVTGRLEAENRRRALEEQLRQARHLEALGRLAGGVAHDFNNLLGAILMNAELLKLGGPAGQGGSADAIVKAAQRGKGLVSQILTYSRQAERSEDQVNIAAIVREIDQLVRVTLPRNINCEVKAPEEAFIIGDPVQMGQVIMNLCTNAIYAMKVTGGVLRLEVAIVPTKDVASARIEKIKGTADKLVVLRVTDSGSGIPDSIRERIFDPFFSTKPVGDGTGLGLSVVLGIVETHGGQIHFEGAAGGGTVFELYFPNIPGNSGRRSKSSVVESVAGARATSEHVILVDDELMVLEVSAAALRHKGYRVSAFSDPEKVMELIHKQELHGDILVTDLSMPRMTGVELAEQVTRAFPHCPVILCSGYDVSRQESSAKSGLVTSQLSKPYSIVDLFAAVRAGLDKRARVAASVG